MFILPISINKFNSKVENSILDSLQYNILYISALKALESYQVSSKLEWECLQTLQTLATDNSIELCWVPGHRGIDGYVWN